VITTHLIHFFWDGEAGGAVVIGSPHVGALSHYHAGLQQGDTCLLGGASGSVYTIGAKKGAIFHAGPQKSSVYQPGSQAGDIG
jgi:hypothetical protein